MIVQPGCAVGRFVIGMPINECLHLCQSYPAGKPRIDVLYDAQAPVSADIILRIPDRGMQLRFEAVSQRLHMIDVYDPKLIELSYADTQFSGELATEDSRSLLQLYKLFGPTYPGNFDPSLQSYLLHYRGLCLRFPIASQYHKLYQSDNDLVLELPDGTSPCATQVLVFGGSDITRPTLPKAITPYYEPITVRITNCTDPANEKAKKRITVTMEGTHQRSFEIGSSFQDVITDIGTRGNIYVKQTPSGKMKIHSNANGGSQPNSNVPLQPLVASDYFFNMFHLGMDLLIDGETHTVKKVVLMTNCPGQPSFGQYDKCNFRLLIPTIMEGETSSSSQTKKASKKSKSKGQASAEQPSEYGVVTVTANMQWSEVEALVGKGGRPMVRDHGSVENPFGSTLLYAYESCVFEVLRSGYIVSVTVFA